MSFRKPSGKCAQAIEARREVLRFRSSQTVRNPLPLDKPPVCLEFDKQRLLEVAAHSPVEMSVQLCVCRFRLATLPSLLRPGSMLMIGSRKTWWPTWERKLAKELCRSGQDVVLLEVD